MTTEKQLQHLQEEIEKIKERNRRVEADKAWETSKTRTAFISLVTFVLVLVFLNISGGERPMINALIAVAGYWISTESYGILKNWWLKKKG